MKKSRFTETQIVSILKEADAGLPVQEFWPWELAEEFQPSAQTIINWVAQADRNAGFRHDGATTAEKEELRRLRQENKRLREEREILSKAAIWNA